MPISFSCPHCGKSYKVADNLAGKSAPCKGCGQRMTIPAAASADGEMDLAALGPPPGDEPAPMKLPDSPEPARPARMAASRTESSGKKAALSPNQLVKLGVAVVLIGVAAFLIIKRPWAEQGDDVPDLRPDASGEFTASPDAGHHEADADSNAAKQCRANMARVAKAMAAYAGENDGQLPPSLGALIGRAVDGKPISAADFVCPASGRKAPKGYAQYEEAALVNNSDNIDYHYRGAGLKLADAQRRAIYYERGYRDKDQIIHFFTGDLKEQSGKMPEVRNRLR